MKNSEVSLCQPPIAIKDQVMESNYLHETCAFKDTHDNLTKKSVVVNCPQCSLKITKKNLKRHLGKCKKNCFEADQEPADHCISNGDETLLGKRATPEPATVITDTQ